jgi:Transposase DDE domain
MIDSVIEAQLNLDEVKSPAEVREVVADKGYHAADTLEQAHSLQWRTSIPERKQQGQRTWTNKPAGQQAAVYANRRRLRGERSKRLQRKRSELTERSFAHVCETGGARRCWLRGLAKVTKRYLLQVAARNLGLILRKLFGIGTPRSLRGEGGLFIWIRLALYWLSARWEPRWRMETHRTPTLLTA